MVFEGRIDDADPRKLAEANPLNLLFEKALRQDAEAMRHLLTLLQTKHYREVVGRLRGLGTRARTKTLEDIFQETSIILMKKLESGALKDLDEENRKDMLKYFQGLCNGRLRDHVRVRKSPALQRHMPPLHEGIPDRDARIPGDQHNTEHLALLRGAMSRLEPEHARILEMHLDDTPYKQMALVTGKKAETLRNLVVRIKGAVVADILPRSETARIHFERKQKEPLKVLPSWEELLEAIESLPVELQEAVSFVHLEKHTEEEMARQLGDNGARKAKALLKDAYQSLSAQLSYPFPDGFRVIVPRIPSDPRTPTKLPTRAEIEGAVAKLPPMYRDAFRFVYMEGHDAEDLGRHPDIDGTDRAQSRLDEACRLLSVKFKEVFPDAYYMALRDEE